MAQQWDSRLLGSVHHHLKIWLHMARLHYRGMHIVMQALCYFLLRRDTFTGTHTHLSLTGLGDQLWVSMSVCILVSVWIWIWGLHLSQMFSSSSLPSMCLPPPSQSSWLSHISIAESPVKRSYLPNAELLLSGKPLPCSPCVDTGGRSGGCVWVCGGGLGEGWGQSGCWVDREANWRGTVGRGRSGSAVNYLFIGWQHVVRQESYTTRKGRSGY